MADLIPPAPIDAPFGAYNWVDWYQKIRTAINSSTAINWSAITNTPTTLSGYGITDAIHVVAGAITIVGTVNDGSGAFTGTLTNSPGAGPPSKWLTIDDNGTPRYIPVW